MEIAIIGAGFTGLSAALKLAKEGHKVTLFEKDSQPGGLAIGYKEQKWNWALEKHYHHWFTNDNFVLDLAKEINYPVIITKPKTSIFLDGNIFRLDSPKDILSFSKLELIERVRMATVLAFLRFNPFWKPLEKINAVKFLNLFMGKKAFSLLWEPQLRNKMGKYADSVSLVWFWSRIKKRTKNLAYPERGYLSFATALVEEIKKLGGKINYETEVLSVKQLENIVELTTKKQASTLKNKYDKVIVTLPSYQFLKICPQLPASYTQSIHKLQGLGATNLVMRLNKSFMLDGTYWLSICEPNAPVMVVVEHTNLISEKNYNNEHIVYLGNYPDPTSENFLRDKHEALKAYDPLLKRINPDYRKNLIDLELFKAPFAQPIIPSNYSRFMPKIETPLKNVYLANIEQVYPWDRGTNYAVELGYKVAKLCTND